MSDTAVPTTPKDGLITFGATYVMLTVAGKVANAILPSYLWMWKPDRVASLVLFAALVSLYAFGTGPGRRTGWRAYLLCGVTLPVFLWLVAIIGYVLPLPYEAFKVYVALLAGFGVGFRVAGGGYPPFEVTLLLWMLGIVLATVAAPMVRDLPRKVAV